MKHTVLLYGATGHSGRLIAAEAAQAGMCRGGEYSMILGGRDDAALAQLGQQLDMDHQAFPLDDQVKVPKLLAGVDVIINAAGPFAMTAPRLAKSAVVAGVHYVDINGELDVYKTLEDVGRLAEKRQLAMVCGAGHSPAASNVLLYAALGRIRSEVASNDKPIALGAVRIAHSRLTTLSRGSALTLMRSIREQVAIVRMGKVDSGGHREDAPVLWHEPVGKLEHLFNFGSEPQKPHSSGTERSEPRRIATAANLVDTFSAWQTTTQENFVAKEIISYVEAGALERLAYQLSPLFAPLTATSWALDFANLSLTAFAPGPTAEERDAEGHTVVLEIEDPHRAPLINWRWYTPNPYDFTARIAVEIAKRLCVAPQGLRGWLTPSDVLTPGESDLSAADHGRHYLRGCRLDGSTIQAEGGLDD